MVFTVSEICIVCDKCNKLYISGSMNMNSTDFKFLLSKFTLDDFGYVYFSFFLNEKNVYMLIVDFIR